MQTTKSCNVEVPVTDWGLQVRLPEAGVIVGSVIERKSIGGLLPFASKVKDYEILTDALLRRFNLTEERFKQKFRTAKPDVDETPAQFVTRLESCWMRWIDFENVEKDFDGLMNSIKSSEFKKGSRGK